MRALVVHESMFGNTEAVAAAVVEGLQEEGFEVTSVDVADAPPLASVDADLLVVGGPTHAFSMTRPGTREDAVRQGAPAERAGTGLREWFGAAPAAKDSAGGSRLAAAFDTRASKVRWLPKSAGTRSGHVLQHLGFTLVDRPTGFLVDDVKGPLLQGETERALLWGRELARATRGQLATHP